LPTLFTIWTYSNKRRTHWK